MADGRHRAGRGRAGAAVFIEWGAGTPFPGAAATNVEVGLELRGDAQRIAAWLGDDGLPISVRPGTPAVSRVVLRGAAGEFALTRP